MAYEEITSPIALDESFNTTENTPRNVADVLAEELSNLADAVKPDAGDIALDTISGMSANNVQDGIEELKGTLTNTTLKYTGTATSQGLVVTDIDFTNKIKVVYAENWTAGGIKLYCLIRPSLTNKVVAMPVTDNFSKGASDGDTVDIYVSFNGY